MIRRPAAFVMVLALYVLIAALLAEGVIRVFGLAAPASSPGYFWRTDDPVTGWSLQPGASGRWFNPMREYDQAITVNARGLRSPEICAAATGDCPAADDTLRVLLLGDSYVEALHVPLEATFGQQLGLALAQAGLAGKSRVEVVNAGVSGWGTDQQLLWLRSEGVHYRPDLVLLAFFPGNDFMNNHMPLELANFGGVRKPWFSLADGALQLNDYPYDREAARESARRLREAMPAPLDAAPAQVAAPPLVAVGDWLRAQSALYRYLDPRLRAAAPGVAVTLARWGLLQPGQETSDRAMGPDYIPVAYGVYRQEPDATWQAAFDVTAALLTELHKETTALEASLAALVLTAPEQVDTQRWQAELSRYPAMAGLDWSLDAPTQAATAALARAGIPALDLLPLFRAGAAEGAHLHFRDDGHWTAEGHALAGRAAAAFVAAQGLAPLAPGAAVAVPIPGSRPHLLTWLLWIVLGIIAVSVVWSAYQTGPVAWLRGAVAQFTTVGELMVYLVRRRQYVLLPLMVVLLLFGGLLLIAQSSIVGPFIYPLF